MCRLVKSILYGTIVILSLLISCKEQNTNGSNLITIGKQYWAISNLDISSFRNGDPIPLALSEEEWRNACENHKPISCYYDFNEENGAKYGRLYNWYAIHDERGLAPQGYKIPNIEDFTVLSNYLGGESIAGIKLKSPSHWGNVESACGFNAVPSGFLEEEFVDEEFANTTQKRPEGTGFWGNGIYTGYWCFDERPLACELQSNDSRISFNGNSENYMNGFSVRLIKLSKFTKQNDTISFNEWE